MADFWGVELAAADARQGRRVLASALLDPELVAETVEILPPPARGALDELQAQGGRQRWSLFVRRFGRVREMGPARRERERPHLDPVSPAEVLWYRALVARGFFESPTGPEEYAYIPDDLLPRLPRREGPTPASEPPIAEVPGRPAVAAERAHEQPVDDRLLDHACTLLAALRQGVPLDGFTGDWPCSPATLKELLAAAGLLEAADQPAPEAAREFLGATRGEALARLATAWRGSDHFNELRLLPGLQAEGEWTNDPVQAREAVLGFLGGLPPGTWWSLSAFVSGVREGHPDFQRQAGDYDSWFLRDTRTGDYLRGFENWEAVDGELLRFLITGPLHWLGVLDVASREEAGPVTAFRFSAWARPLLAGEAPPGLPVEDRPVTVRSDGRLTIPRLAPRDARYQLSRFCVWEEARADEYRYRLTPASLAAARERNLRVGHLLALLRRHAGNVPPNVPRALERWERRGAEARLAPMTVLRVRSPEMLQELRRSRAARFLGNPLGPTTIAVNSGAEEQVLAVLAELGYLGEWLD